MEVRRYTFANFARSVLAAGVSASATELRVAESQGDIFPNIDPTYDEIFSVVLTHGSAYEIVYVTQKAADFFTIERGKESTTAQAFPEGAVVVHTVTAGFWEQQSQIGLVLSGEYDELNDEIDLSWTVPAQVITGYELERSTNGGSFVLLDTLGLVDEYTDATAVFPNQYRYRIKALPDDEYSNTITIDTAFFETFMLIHVEGDEIYEVTGFPVVSVVGGGAVSAVQAKFGTQSFHNPGTSNAGFNFVRVEGGPTDFVFPGQFTWEGWFYFTANPNDSFENIFANNINFPAAGFIQMARYSGADRYLMVNTSAGGMSLSANSVPLNQWVHLAVTRNASNQLRIWMDGVLLGTQSVSGTMGGDLTGVSSFDVGRGHAADNGDAVMFFEEIRVTKACRYTANFTPPTEPFPPFPGN